MIVAGFLKGSINDFIGVIFPEAQDYARMVRRIEASFGD